LQDPEGLFVKGNTASRPTAEDMDELLLIVKTEESGRAGGPESPQRVSDEPKNAPVVLASSKRDLEALKP